MPTQPRLYPRQSSLRVSGTQSPRPSKRLNLIVNMIRHIKHILGRLLKTLLPVPRHILDHHERAVGDQDVVQSCMLNDCALVAFDDAGEDGEA